MAELRALSESDVTQIKRWPSYHGDMAQMDSALRKKGWLDECRSMCERFHFCRGRGR